MDQESKGRKKKREGEGKGESAWKEGKKKLVFERDRWKGYDGYEYKVKHNKELL